MKAKYILEAIAALRAADQKIAYLADKVRPYETGHLRLAQECSHIAAMLEVASGLQSLEVEIEQPVDYVKEQFEMESA